MEINLLSYIEVDERLNRIRDSEDDYSDTGGKCGSSMV